MTTGNLAGVDLWLDDARSGTIKIETNVVSGRGRPCSRLAGDRIIFDGGGLGRKLSVYRLPETDWSRRVTLDHTVTFSGQGRSSSLRPRDTGRWQPSVVKPNLPGGLVRWTSVPRNDANFGIGTLAVRSCARADRAYSRQKPEAIPHRIKQRR